MAPSLRQLLLILTILTAACAVNPAAKFLPTANPAKDAWFNKVVDIDLADVPLAQLTSRPMFQDIKMVFNGVDSEALVSLQAEQVTRRQALYLLANKYGLSMTLDSREDKTLTIVIGNREGQRAEMRPLK